jgi:hypothetical protein
MYEYRKNFYGRMVAAQAAAAHKRGRGRSLAAHSSHHAKPDRRTAEECGLDNFDLWLMAVEQRVKEAREQFRRRLWTETEYREQYGRDAAGDDSIPF